MGAATSTAGRRCVRGAPSTPKIMRLAAQTSVDVFHKSPLKPLSTAPGRTLMPPVPSAFWRLPPVTTSGPRLPQCRPRVCIVASLVC